MTGFSTAREDLYLLTPEEIFERLQSKEWRMNNLYKIILEDSSEVDFDANEIQTRIRAERSGYRDIILKYRQWGVTTEFIVSAVDEILWWGRNITYYFVTHRKDLLDEFFRKAKFTLENLHPLLKPLIPAPTRSNSNELFFKGTNNMLRIGMDVRGKTPTHLHVSEFAHMTPEVQAKLFIAMENFRKTRITIESTANGMGDIFEELCSQAKQGDSVYKLLFYGFDVDSRNEMDADGMEPTPFEETFIGSYLAKFPRQTQLRKMMWRRKKIHTYNVMGEDGEAYFNQENPITIEVAFRSSGSAVFDANYEYRIMQPIETVEDFDIFLPPCDELIIGIDIAEGGKKGDYSTISARRRDGRIAFQLKKRCTEVVLAEKLDFILTYVKEDQNWAPKKYKGVIVPENNVGLAFINECRKYKWFQYMLKQRSIDSADFDDNIVQKFGFRMTATSKDMIIREYRGALYEKKIWVTPKLHAEILTYQYDKNNRPNALGKNHDDLLVADMIAYHTSLHESWVVRDRVTEKELDQMGLVERHMARLKRGDYSE